MNIQMFYFLSGLYKTWRKAEWWRPKRITISQLGNPLAEGKLALLKMRRHPVPYYEYHGGGGGGGSGSDTYYGIPYRAVGLFDIYIYFMNSEIMVTLITFCQWYKDLFWYVHKFLFWRLSLVDIENIKYRG